MQEITITAKKRESAGKGVARKLRASGRIPGVFYGKGREPIPIDLDATQFEQILRHLESESIIVNLDIDGNASKALLREVQYGPIRDKLLHADFYQVAMDQEINISVPIHFEGVSTGVKNDGCIMQTVMRELEISCLPDRIPQSVDIDVSEMAIGDSVHVRDLDLKGIKVISDHNRTIVTIIPPTVIKVAEPVAAAEEEVEAEAEAAEGEAEPEVITEKSKEREQEDKKK